MSDLTRLARDLRPLILRARGARVYNSGALAIADNTPTALTFNSERWDDESFHSTVTNTSRLTIPTPGRYTVGAHVSFASNATGYRVVSLVLNGTTSIGGDTRAGVSSETTRISISAIYEFAASDYVEVIVRQTSGGSLNVEAASAYSPEFWIYGAL